MNIKQKRLELKNIKTMSEYEQLKKYSKFTDEQREIMDMIYLKGWDYLTISDNLGCAEITVKRKVKKILNLI